MQVILRSVTHRDLAQVPFQCPVDCLVDFQKDALEFQVLLAQFVTIHSVFEWDLPFLCDKIGNDILFSDVSDDTFIIFTMV